MKEAARIAYNMMRNNPKLEASDEKSPESHAASIAHAILANKKGYAEGGMVDGMCGGGSMMSEGGMVSDEPEDMGDDMEAISESGDDSLAPVGDPGDDPILKEEYPERKKRLSSIIASMRMK